MGERGGRGVNSRQLPGPALPVLVLLWWRSGLSLGHLPRREGPILQIRKLSPIQLGRGRARGKWGYSNSRAYQSEMGEAAGLLFSSSVLIIMGQGLRGEIWWVPEVGLSLSP